MKKWKMQWSAWIALAIVFCIRKCESSDFAKHGLFWGGKPFIFGAITQNGVWENILGSNLNVTLPKPILSVISYELAVEGLRGIDGSPLPREGTTDYLQVRCLIDGVPLRTSSAMTGNYDVESRTPATVSTIFAFNLSAGSHDISLQWRKLGSRIEKWTTSQTATNRGYSMIVHSDHKQVAYVHEMQDAYLYAPNRWSGLSRSMSFSLPTESTVTIRYSLVVQPQLLTFIKDRSIEFVTTRALVDGAAYTQSSETFGTNPWNPITSTVSGQFRLTMLAGNHTVLLQWKKSGSAFKGWASSPSALDGFASSRNIIVSVDKFTSPALFSHNRDILTNGNDWSVVGGRSLAFTLLKESALVFTYGLPATQFGNPNLDANVWSPLSQLNARLLIDGVAYTFAGTTLAAGSRRFEDLHGQLALVLPSGPHTVALQWRSPNSVKWTTLNDLDDGFAHGQTLLTFISSENAQPTIAAPSRLHGIKDTPIVFKNVSIADIDAELAPGVSLLLAITVHDGTLHFPNAPLLGNDIEFVHGEDNTTAILFDTVANINMALNGMQYLPRYLFYGEDKMVLFLNDQGNTGFDGPLFDTKTVLLEVSFVDYPFTLDVPSRLHFASNTSSEFAVEPIVLEDVDSLTKYFRADLSVVCGMLSLESNLVNEVIFLQGSAVSQSISIFALFPTIQAILKEIVYIPYTTCNSRVHPEIFTLTVSHSEIPSQTITKYTVINYVRPKIQPILRSPRYPLWQVDGVKPLFQTDGSRNESYKQSFISSLGNEMRSYNAIQSGAKANMSEIVLYSSSEMDYKLTVQFGNFNIAIQGTFYVVVGLQSSITVQLLSVVPAIAHGLGCSVNNVPFNFIVSDSRTTGTCEVLWTQELSSNSPIWMKVYYVASDNEMIESNYASLFLVKAVEVSSVHPPAVLSTSRSVITVTCSDPTLVTTCVLGNDTLQVVSRDEDTVSCVVPLLFDNTTALPVKLTYAGSYVTESSVSLQILERPLLTAATLIYDEANFGWIAELSGTWSADTLNSIGVLSFTVSNATNTVDYVDDADILFGFVSLSTEQVEACLVHDSACFASVSFDSFTTNDIQLTVSRFDSSSINNQMVSEYGLFVVEGGYLNIYGISATSKFTNSSCYFDNEFSSQLHQTSSDYLTCLLPSSGKTSGVVIIANQFGEELLSRDISIDSAPTIYDVSPRSIQPNTTTKIVVDIGSSHTTKAGCWHCVFNTFIVSAVAENENKLACVCPPVMSSSVEVRVFYNYVGVSGPASEILVTQRPELLSLEPSYGVIGQETEIVIKGSAFHLLPTPVYCKFGDGKLATKATILDESSVSCKTPKAEFAVRVDVLLAAEDVIVARNSLPFQFLAQPILSTVTPTLVSTNIDTKMLITGKDFPLSISILCQFGERMAKAVVINSTMVLCDAPKGLPSSDMPFQLIIGSYNLPAATTIKAAEPWRIEHVEQKEVFAGQLTKLKLRGNSNLNVMDDLACFLGSSKCVSELVLSSEVFCSCPKTFSGSLNLNLFVNDLQVEWKDANSLTVLILPVPSIVRVHPMYIPLQESVLVVIEALDFESIFIAGGSSSVSCSFGSSGWSTAVVYNSTSLGCFTPLVRFPGSVSMALRFAKDALLQVPGELQVIDRPKLLKLSSTKASSGGGKAILVTGTNLSPTWRYICDFIRSDVIDGVWIDSSSIHCFTPSNAAVGQSSLIIQVVGFADPIGVFPFEFVAAPVASGILPSKTPLSGGASVNVTGFSFNEEESYYCRFGNATVAATRKTANLLQCVCPSAVETGVVPFAILLDGVELGASKDLSFEYIPLVTLLEVYPSAAPIDGEVLLSITGNGFNAVKAPLFCAFGDVTIPAQVKDDEMLFCVSPVVQSSKVVPLQLVLGDDYFALGELDFSFYANPTIVEVMPLVLSSAGGNEVVVTVSDIANVKMEDVTCLFGNASVAAVANGLNQYWCRSPSLLGSEVIFTLEINGVAIRSSHTLTLSSEIILSSISPSAVFNNYEGNIVLHGDGFFASNSADCVFRNVLSVATIVSNNEIQCAMPALLGELSTSLLLDGQLFGPEKSIYLNVLAVPTFELVGSKAYPLGTESTIVFQSNSVFAMPSENVTCAIGNSTSVAIIDQTANLLVCKISSIMDVSTEEVALIFAAGKINTGINISFVESPLISSFSPLIIAHQTNALISIRGDHFLAFADSLTCVIESDILSAVVVSDNRLECATMPLSTGNYSLALYLQDIFISEEFVLSVIDPGLVTALEAIYDESKKQKNIVLTGNGFRAGQKLNCYFGEDTVDGIILSAERMECPIPLHVVVKRAISVSINGVNVPFAKEVAYEFVEDARVTGIAPALVPYAGGDIIEVSGTGFSVDEGYSCRFGESITSAAIVVSSQNLKCLTPLLTAVQAISLSIIDGSGRQLAESFSLDFVAPVYIIRSDRSTLASDASDRLILFGEGFVPGVEVTCVFGSSSTQGFVENENIISCATPVIPAGVFISVQIMLGGYLWTDSAVQVQFEKRPEVHDVSPSTLHLHVSNQVRVVGEFSNETAFCRFGDDFVKAAIVSNVELICDSPIIEQCNTMFSVELNGVESFPRTLPCDGLPVVIGVQPLTISTNREATLEIAFDNVPSSSLDLVCSLLDATAPLQVDVNGFYICKFSTFESVSKTTELGIYAGEVSIFKTSLSIQQDINSAYIVTPSIVMVDKPAILRISGVFDVSTSYFCSLSNIKPIPAIVISYQELQCVFSALSTIGITKLVVSSSSSVLSELDFDIVAMPVVTRTKLGISVSSNWIKVTLQEAFTDSAPLYCEFGSDKVLASKHGRETYWCTIPSQLACSGGEVKVVTEDEYVQSPGVAFSGSSSACTVNDVAMISKPFALFENETESYQYGAAVSEFNELLWSYQPMQIVLSNEKLSQPRFIDTSNEVLAGEKYFSHQIGKASGSSSTSKGSNSSPTISAIGYGSNLVVSITNYSPKIVDALNGTWIIVTGRNFDRTAQCVIGNVSTRTFVYSSMNLTCFVPHATISKPLMTVFLSVRNGEHTAWSQSVVLWYDVMLGRRLSADLSFSLDTSSIESSHPMSAASDVVCLLSEGCDISVKYLTAQLTQEETFQNNEDSFGDSTTFEADIFAPLEDVHAEVYYADRRVLATSCSDCFIAFVGENLQSSAPICLIIDNATVTCSHSLTDPNTELWCKVPDIIPPGNMSIRLLGSNCSSQLYSTTVQVALQTVSNRCEWEGKVTSTALVSAEIVEVNPSIASTNGGMRISLFGHGLSNVVAVAMIGNNGLKYYAGVDVVATSELQLTSPAIQVTNSFTFTLILADRSSVATSARVKFLTPLQVFDATELVLSSEVHTLSVQGQDFSSLKQVTCLIQAYNGTSYTTSAQIFDQGHLFCSVPAKLHLQGAKCSISFNGIEYSNQVTIASLKSAYSISLQLQSSYRTVEFPGYKNVSDTNVDHFANLDPMSVTKSCSSVVYLPFTLLETNRTTGSYFCVLNGEITGQSFFTAARTAICSLPSQSPGNYAVRLVDEAGSVAAREYSIICVPPPHVSVVELMPKYDAVNTVFAVTGRYFVESDDEFVCAYDSTLVKASVSTSTSAVCVFKNLLSSTEASKFTIIANGALIFSNEVCLTEALLYGGGVLTEELCATKAKIEAENEMSSSTVLRIRSISPRMGLTNGQSFVRIAVEGLKSLSKLTCQFDQVTVPASRIDEESVVCRTPAHAPGNVSVSLSDSTTGLSWCCDWFYYNPPLLFTSYFPTRINANLGGMILLQVRNLDTSGLVLYCHVNSLIEIAMRINESTIACAIPQVYTKVVNISVGSVTEKWSNDIQIAAESTSATLWSFFPSFGSTKGNTTITISIPSGLSLSDPYCLVDSRLFAPETKSALAIECITSPSQMGVVEVSVIDGADRSNPTYYAGTYTYLPSAEVFRVDPATYEQGKDVDVTVFGLHFLDSSNLVCVINNNIIIPARWLSSTMLKCKVLSDYVDGDSSLQVAVSNNRLDRSDAVTIATVAPYEIESVLPLAGFVVGGNDVIITLTFPSTERFSCIFGGIRTRAILIEADRVVCEAPARSEGEVKLSVTTHNGIIVGKVPYTYLPMPVLESAASQAIVATLQSRVLFKVTKNVPPTLYGRFRDVNGALIKSAGCQLVGEELVCDAVIASEDNVYLTLDISLDGDFFISNAGSVQVFPRLSVLWTDPLSVADNGGDILQFGFEQDRVLSSILCVFKSDGSIVMSVQAIVLDAAAAGSCAAPALDADAINTIELQQFGHTIFGPSYLIVYPGAVVESVSPMRVYTGIPQTLSLVFKVPVKLYPVPHVEILGNEYPITLLDGYHGVVTIYASSVSSLKTELFLTYPSVTSSKTVIALLDVIDYIGNVVVNTQPIVQGVVTNYTYTSSTCKLDENVYCKVSTGDVMMMHSDDGCHFICSVIITQQIAEERLTISLCGGDTCNRPLRVDHLDILLPVVAVQAVPSFGSVLGGPVIRILGNGFQPDASLDCVFDAIRSSATIVSSTELKCILPANVPGIVNIAIERRGVVVSTSLAEFHYLPAMSILSIEPKYIAMLGGTAVTVVVQEYLNSSLIQYCRFNEIYTLAMVESNKQVNCEAPALNVQEVSFALAAGRENDFTEPVTLPVRNPLYPVFLDPTVVTEGQVGNINIYFDSTIQEIENIACIIDGEQLEVSFSPEMITCHYSSLSSGTKRLQLIADQIIFFAATIEVRAAFSILSVWPQAAFIDQVTPVEVTVTGEGYGESTVHCCFGPYQSPAALLAYNKWQCYSPKINQGGVNVVQELLVGLAIGSNFCDMSILDFSLYPPFTVVNQTGSTSGTIFGGDTVILQTAEYYYPSTVYCRFGATIVVGQFVEDVGVVCLTPPTPRGIVSVDLSVNGIEFQPSGAVFNFIMPDYDYYNSPTGTGFINNRFAGEFGVTGFVDLTTSASSSSGGAGSAATSSQPLLFSLSGNSFPSSSQFNVILTGRNFEVDSVCRLVSGAVLTTTYLSSTQLRCDFPVLAAGSDTVYVQNANGAVSSSQTVQFVASPVVGSVTGVTVSPAHGPRNAQTLLTVSVIGLNAATNYYCLIGDEWVPSFNATNTTLNCLAPLNSVIGQVSVRVGTPDPVVLSGNGYFEYIDDPVVLDIQPKRATAFSTVIIFGLGFTRFPSLSLSIGGSNAPCTTLSNARLICTIPNIAANTYQVFMTTNGQHLVQTGLEYTQFTPTALTSLWPFNGPALRGQTVLSVYGSNIPLTIDVFCIIDTAIVPANVLTSNLAQCRVPPHVPGMVNVSLVADGIFLHPPEQTLQYAYVPDVSVVQLEPANGYTAGEFPILVFGSNFVNTSSLACRFADINSRAIFVSTTTLVCLSPSTLGRPELATPTAIPVEVTLNGYDFSESNVYFAYSEPCDQGFFCPGLTRALCPNGTYCPPNSRNFTLCPTGTFQSLQGQTSCNLCPVGYLCPEIGLPRPIQCPNGLICDSMGLTASAKLCPAGSYCLNTTKSSSPDEFKGLIGWVVNNITGIVSFNSSEFNYSYSFWPAPAVGKSRPQSPPESSCDGLVCEGGSSAVLAEAPFPCPIGHYCRVGAGTQIPIPKNFSSPQRCFDGFFCPRGSVSPEGAGPCPNGYYCPTQLDSIVCPAGTYCPGVGNTAPVECYPGTYNPFTGRANCTVCPTGYICPGWGLLLPEICPAGFVCSALGLSYPVVTCPGGYRCEEGTRTLDPADTTIFKPRVCKAGQFCLGGVASPINIEWVSSQPWGSTHPQLCSEGTYCQAGAYLSSGSGLCFQGHYCPPNSSFPIATPVGNFASGLGAVAPTLCYPGTYAPLEAQVTCDTCPSGFTCQSYGSYIPTICEKGTYRSQVDSLTCVNCPTGTYSFETGAPDLSLCLPCPQGAVCPIVQLTTFASSSICPSGYICGAGTDLSRQFRHLTPAGFSSSTSTIPTAQYDAPCSSGYYCRRGTPTTQETAGKCTVGAFCPQSTPVSPSSEILCPDYTTSPTQTVEVTGCKIYPTPVCSKERNVATDPTEDLHYYSGFTYTTLDDSATEVTLESSLSAASPTGELQVVATIHSLNKTSSTPTWLNDTIEAFRACPLYGNGIGGDVITIVGRNFRDTGLNFCRFRPCLSSNQGVHLRRCKNQVNSATGVSLDIVGNVSEQAFITKAKFISNTRLECTTPRYLFNNNDESFNPSFAVNNYICAYVDAFGDYDSAGNYSYIRPCDTVAGTICPNKPATGYEFFSRVYFPCTTTETLSSICSNYPRLGYMMNPCMSGEVAVEVTNDGEHFSGGEDLQGQFIVSTIRYYEEGGTIYDNFKNVTRNATLAVYTMIMPEFFPRNPLILESDKAHCQLPIFAEESERKREKDFFLLKLMEIATISIDLSFLPDDFVYDEHYKIAIYVRPSRCDSNYCNSAGVQLSPEEYTPCQQPVQYSNWFRQTDIPKNVVNNITLWALEDSLFQVEIEVLYGLHATYAPLFYNTTTVTIHAPSRAQGIVGASLDLIRTRPLTPYVSFTQQLVPQHWFFCAVVYLEDADRLYSPLNLPPLYSDYAEGRVLIMNNVTENNPDVPLVLDPFADLDVGVSFWMMPATTPDESKEQLDAYFETFQYTTYESGSGYTFDFDTIVLPYFPYFSNCYGFDSYIPIWYVTENHQLCELPDSYPASWVRYKYPPLPSQDDIRFVGPFDFFTEPISDWCQVSLSCNYEEELDTAEATPRWFELSSSSSVFSLIRFPLNYFQYTGRKSITVSQDDQGGAAYAKALAEISSDNFIDVLVTKTTASSSCSIQCFARSWTLTIQYYQVDSYNKKLILATLGGTNFDRNTTNTGYNLNIDFYGLGFLDLILTFSFDLPIFIVIYCFLGILSVALAFIGWVVNRMTTLLQNPPQLRMVSMIALIVPPSLAGVSIAAVLIWFMTAMANLFIFGVFVGDPSTPLETTLGSLYIDQYPLTYNDIGGSTLSDDQLQIQRYGRMGLAFFIIGFCCFHAASKMYFPRPESKRELEIAQRRTPLAKKRELWKPIMWKKLNFIFASFMLATILYLVIQLSYWGSFGDFYYQIIVVYVLLGEAMRYLARRQLNDTILIAPLSAAWVFVQSLISFGSPDFLVFILQNYSDFAISTFQRVFQKYYIELAGEVFAVVSRNLRIILKMIVPKYLHGRFFGAAQTTAEEDKEYRKRAVEGVVLKDEENESVEPILEYFGDVCFETVMTIYFPYVVYLLMQYRLTIYIPIIYGIRQSDMIIYLFYQLFLVLFQPIVDIFNHSQCELFWGWKIYEYLVYSRYRFLQRETRWKGMENTLDECIEESLRRLDQMCFSSQYFLMLTIQTNGIVYLILAYQVWIQYNYSPFSDPAVFFVAGYIWAVYLAFTWVVMFLAVRLKVWRIKHENTAWHTVQEEDDELDIPAWEEIKGASSEAFLLNQRITSETFRYKFLNYNRTWLINQLPLILTPRTLRRSRPYLINQFQRIINARRDDISDDDDDEQQQVKFGPVSLTAPSRNIVRWWLGRARRRMRLRTIVEPLIKRARGSQCEICLSRKQLQVEYEVDLDTMAGMYDKSFPGDEEVDQVQWKTFWTNNQRYHTICLACVTQRKAKAARDAYSKGALDPSIFDDDNQEDYPDWGPVFLSGASKAILLNWYRKAQKLRAGKRKQRAKKERVTKDISDDEGDDPAFSWLKEGLRNITPATKAIAIRWMRSARARLQQKRGKGAGLRERDVFQEEQVGEGFRSGLKSKMLRK